MTAKQVGQRRERGAKLSLLLVLLRARQPCMCGCCSSPREPACKHRVHGPAPGEGTVMGKCLFLGWSFTGPQCTAACGRFKGVWRYISAPSVKYSFSALDTPPQNITTAQPFPENRISCNGVEVTGQPPMPCPTSCYGKRSCKQCSCLWVKAFEGTFLPPLLLETSQHNYLGLSIEFLNNSVWLRWILPWGAWIPWGNPWLPLLEVIHTSGHGSCMRFSVCCDSYRTCNILFVYSHPPPEDTKFLLIRVNRQVFAAGQAEMCAVSNDDSKTQSWHWGCDL